MFDTLVEVEDDDIGMFPNGFGTGWSPNSLGFIMCNYLELYWSFLMIWFMY